MILNKITLKNFGLIKEAVIEPGKTNLIQGTNYDDPQGSSNGSGKSTIINAILFCLHGEVAGLNLADLVSIGTAETKVDLEFSLGTEKIRIVRKIPSELNLSLNGKEVVANTLKLKQQWIDEQFGSLNFFKLYRCIDTTKGINILSLGNISLRKNLMEFMDSLFTDWRNNLLKKKNERELFNKDKRLYKFSLSEKRMKILEQAIIDLNQQLTGVSTEKNQQQNVISQVKSEIQSREKLIYYKQQDISKLNNGICPILGSKCTTLDIKQGEVKSKQGKELDTLRSEIIKFQKDLEGENDSSLYYQATYNLIDVKRRKTQDLTMKLKEAFKFSAYKFTTKDVMLYAEAIKLIDEFAAWYINEWLAQLAIIINDLLRQVNLEVTFTEDKSFLKIKNGTNELKYDQLSAGQKVFLGAIFKIAILLQNGQTDGLLLIDEGINNLDLSNLGKFIDILKGLNFQVFVVYQNAGIMEDVKTIDAIREEGVTTIK